MPLVFMKWCKNMAAPLDASTVYAIIVLIIQHALLENQEISKGFVDNRLLELFQKKSTNTYCSILRKHAKTICDIGKSWPSLQIYFKVFDPSKKGFYS